MNRPDPIAAAAVEAEGSGLRLEDVSVTYRTGLTAVEDASFAIPRGTITALVGVNGSGKSTLFKAIMGFVPLATGRVEILGRPAREALAENLVAYVPQAEEVDWTFPVLVEDVVMMGRYGHMGWLRRPGPRDRELVEAALARVGMAAFRDRQIGELSGGQKKRVFLARALAQEGQVILLDEPFTGVDVKTEDQIVKLLTELRDEGRVMLISTHNLGSVPEYCDHAVLINRRGALQRPDGAGLHPGEPGGGLRRQAAPLRARRRRAAPRRRGPPRRHGADRRRAAVRDLFRHDRARSEARDRWRGQRVMSHTGPEPGIRPRRGQRHEPGGRVAAARVASAAARARGPAGRRSRCSLLPTRRARDDGAARAVLLWLHGQRDLGQRPRRRGLRLPLGLPDAEGLVA